MIKYLPLLLIAVSVIACNTSRKPQKLDPEMQAAVDTFNARAKRMIEANTTKTYFDTIIIKK